MRRVEIPKPVGGVRQLGIPAKEVDLIEQPLAKSSAKMTGDVLSVKIPAYGIASVMVG